jgi:hypothetical protein
MPGTTLRVPAQSIHSSFIKSSFAFSIDHCVDIITNSSSELFVLEGEEKNIVEALIASVYPDYLTEYHPLQGWDDLSNSELLSMYANKLEWTFDESKVKNNLPEGFTFEELFSWDSRGNLINNYDALNDSNRNHMINYLSKGKKKFFLYSIDENPNWDYQEKLSEIADRYHLG